MQFGMSEWCIDPVCEHMWANIQVLSPPVDVLSAFFPMDEKVLLETKRVIRSNDSQYFFQYFEFIFFFAAQPRDSKETLIYRLKFVGDWLFDIIHGKIADKGGWLILWEWCSASVYSWPLLNTWGRQLIGVVRCYWKIRRLFRNWSNINIEYSSVL